MRPAFHAAVLASFMSITPALAQTAAPTAATDASLRHSALKATTFKIGTIIAGLTILSLAAGDVFGGVALTVFNTAAGWALYTANDYIWDTYAPPPAKLAAEQSFDATSDVWRTTGKFLTYKPVAAAIKFTSLYVYTGSVATTLVFGTVSTLTNTAVFYVNNLAWDFYDWSARGTAAAIPAKP